MASEWLLAGTTPGDSARVAEEIREASRRVGGNFRQEEIGSAKRGFRRAKFWTDSPELRNEFEETRRGWGTGHIREQE